VKMTESRWIFVIDIVKKPGVLNAVTGVFTNWGINLETTMLNDLGPEGSNGKLILSFASTRRKMQIIARTVRRLSKVVALQSYPYETHELRMVAACHVPPDYKAEENEKVEIEYLKRRGDKQVIYISGTVADVNAYLKPMLQRKEILELLIAILTV
jgi:acetolactate synthase small subunit